MSWEDYLTDPHAAAQQIFAFRLCLPEASPALSQSWLLHQEDLGESDLAITR